MSLASPRFPHTGEKPSGEQWESHSHGELSQLPLQGGPTRSCPTPGHPQVGPPGCPGSPGSLSPAANGGGTTAHWLDADYLFSSDAAHPDTRSIHESLSYLEGRATVFHSCYLSVCASTRAAERPAVILGHFVLPPACLHEGEHPQLSQPDSRAEGLQSLEHLHSLLWTLSRSSMSSFSSRLLSIHACPP
ncbi:telomere repeats-binding bouquet formation protein 2 isoform X3 [Serinus canaria]|uniref:telomere repeats-binding bouquet formation protein 2 isoform X3 n=1 Tax=Serinus canaria TaxID=9135 RepID=UPI0021CC8C08|nr:telomere repeats-binding bouquet formation protein 2 isoform X3 [Serinus canaria]